MSKEATARSAMKLALEGAANYIDALGGDSRKYRQALANEALDKMAENARELGLDYEPAQQEPVAFLANGTRFKISYDNRQSGGQIHGIPPELGGRWVAFVAADDDCHLKLTSPPAQRTWVGLTDEEVKECFESVPTQDCQNYEHWRSLCARNIETKLREKNT